MTAMRYLHTMIRVRDLPAALRFFCDGLGLQELRRREHEAGRFTLIFLGTDPDPAAPQLELTHNWDHDAPYGGGRAVAVDAQRRRVVISPPRRAPRGPCAPARAA